MLLFQALTKCWNVFTILHPSLCVANITHSYFSRCFRIALSPNWRSGRRIITDGSGLPERVSHVVCKFMRTPLLALLLLTKIVTKPNVINKFLQEKCYRSSDCTMHISFPQLSSQNKYTFLEMWISSQARDAFCAACTMPCVQVKRTTSEGRCVQLCEN